MINKTVRADSTHDIQLSIMNIWREKKKNDMINIYKWLRKFINIHLTSWVAQESGTSAQGKEREVESPKSEKMKWVSKFLKLQIKPIIIIVTGYFFFQSNSYIYP